MGNFTDKLKKIFNPKRKESSQQQPKGKSKMLVVYFVRSTTDKKMFIHPDGKDLFQPVYALKESTIGAACFTNEMAELLIINWLAENGETLEKVSIDQAKKDGAI